MDFLRTPNLGKKMGLCIQLEALASKGDKARDKCESAQEGYIRVAKDHKIEDFQETTKHLDEITKMIDEMMITASKISRM